MVCQNAVDLPLTSFTISFAISSANACKDAYGHHHCLMRRFSGDRLDNKDARMVTKAAQRGAAHPLISCLTSNARMWELLLLGRCYVPIVACGARPRNHSL